MFYKSECVTWAYSISSSSCSGGNFCWLKNIVPPITPNPCRVSGVKGRTLLPYKFTPLPLGQIMPQGWLKTQLQLQANGLAGHLSEFWPNIANSTWIGGNSEGT